MEKNTVWAIALSSVVLVGFFAVQTYLFPPQPKELEQNKTEQTAEIVENQATENETEKTNSKIKENLAIISDVSESENIAEETYTITTNNVKVTFTNRGGDIISYELIEKDDRGNLKNRDADTGKGVELIENLSDKNRAFGLSLGGATRPIIDDLFNAKKLDDYSIGFFKIFTSKNADGTESEFTLVKKYTFKPNDYTFKLDITKEVKWGAENVLVVRVEDTEGAGGIWKPVTVEVVK